jgi:hypothetical protein
VIDDESRGSLAKEIVAVVSVVDAAREASALSLFQSALRRTHWFARDESSDDLAAAAASDDVASVGRLLASRDVNTVWFNEEDLPGSLVRRPRKCSLLDVAAGSGSVETTKYLLEFHSAKPTRGTLKMAISTGRFELIKLMHERLSETELGARVDLLIVATDFHQPEVLRWLLRDATVFEGELLEVFALERKQAGALLSAHENSIRPWWYRTREVSLKWRVSAKLEFVSAPEGFSADGGWWLSTRGGETVLPPLPPGCGGVWTLPEPFGTELLICAELPASVTTIGACAFYGRSTLKRLRIPSSVATIGEYAFFRCSGLTQVEIPSSVTTIGRSSFCGCSGLRRVEISSNVTTISKSAFWGCSGLNQLTIPSSVGAIGSSALDDCSGLVPVEVPSCVTTSASSSLAGCPALTRLVMPLSVSGLRDGDVFRGVTKLDRLTLLGSSLSQAVVASLELCLTPAARVVGPALVGQKFGRFTIAAF